jgi:aspartate/methionine/tyrosine aminotransferase
MVPFKIVQQHVDFGVRVRHVAEQVLANREAILKPILDEMRVRLEMIGGWIDHEPLLEWVPPEGGVVCFPRTVKELSYGVAAFYEHLLKDYGTYVGPGHWFEMPDTCFRLGYGWPTRDELNGGLNAISKALRES